MPCLVAEQVLISLHRGHTSLCAAGERVLRKISHGTLREPTFDGAATRAQEDASAELSLHINLRHITYHREPNALSGFAHSHRGQAIG